MLLFNRSVVLLGPAPELTAITTDLRAYASDKIGTEVALWSAATGAPFGSMAFTTRVDGLAGMAEMNATLAADAGYNERASKLREYMTGTAETHLVQAIHGEVGDASPPVGSVATVTTAVAAAGYDKCVGWGVEVAQAAEAAMGQGVMFGSTLGGTFGQFVWISVSPDPAAADAANDKLMADATYLGMINDAADLWVPAAANRTISFRVA